MLPCKTGNGNSVKSLFALLMVLGWVSVCLGGFTPGYIPVWDNSGNEGKGTVADSIAAKGETITNSIGMTFVYIKPGTFIMGSPENEPGRYDNETQHTVTLTKGYYIQTTEVTQGQWKKVMRDNPSYFKACGDDCPVEQVSWDDVQVFIGKLNNKEGHDKYRLPTEAEWEYACRAGSGSSYANDEHLEALGWFAGNYSGSATHGVAGKKANAWGLYDMHGNVWEWCSDWYENYPQGSVADPKGPDSGSGRVRRGGSWSRSAGGCRASYRGDGPPVVRSNRNGFRLVLLPDQ